VTQKDLQALAWREKFDLIVTLDDDCFPTGSFTVGSVGRTYRRAMQFPRWQESIPGIRTRGLPYADLGTMQTCLHMGLWQNVPDQDAISALSEKATRRKRVWFEPPHGRRIVTNEQYFPLCGMNLAFVRELTPAIYFPLMGEGQPFRRFDDIWGGLFVQEVCRHLRLPISIGDPCVEHRRASDPFVNLVKEAPGIAANERFWRSVAHCQFMAQTVAGCTAELCTHLIRQKDEYIQRTGKALKEWAALFDSNPGYLVSAATRNETLPAE
jgi:reversibly glycosylated polypeptide / UDP-arabinopyranose mutase